MSIRDGGNSSPFTRARPLAVVLAAALALAIPMPQTALAQQLAQAQTTPKAGTWTPTKKGIDRAKELGDKFRKDAGKYYEESPNLQIVEGAIENAVLDKLPIVGDLYGAIKDAPEEVKLGLNTWLRKKKNDASSAQDFERLWRYDAILSCLNGDCSDLAALQSPGTGAGQPGQHTGQPEQLKIKSAVVLVPQIQQGETTRVTVSVQTIIGGDVTIELQSPGNAIGPVRYVVKTKPGEIVTRDFDQFFPTAGQYQLRILAKDARSDDSAKASVVVTGKSQFDGRYTGTILLNARHGDKRATEKLLLSFAVESGALTGTARFANDKPSTVYTIDSKIKGRVDDKGNLTADWSYTHRISKAGGAVWQFVITAPISGMIKDNAVSAQFTCDSKATESAAAEQLRNAQRQQKGAIITDAGISHMAMVVSAYSYKGAPAQLSAQRAK